MMSNASDKFRLYIAYGGAFEIVNNCPIYVPPDCYRVPLKLPVAPAKPMNRRNLLKSVLKKLELPLNAPICMKFIMDNLVVDITDDDDDFSDFLAHAITNQPIEIYLVSSERPMHRTSHPNEDPLFHTSLYHSTHQSGYYGRNAYNEPPQDAQIPTNVDNETHQGNYFESPHETHEETPKIEYALDITHSDQSDSEHDDMEDVNPEKKTNHPFENYVVEDDDQADEDEELDTQQTYDKPIQFNPKPVDIFWNMPPLLSDTQPEVKQRSITIYELSDLVKVGQTFEDKEEFLLQLRTKCVHEGFQISAVYSDKKRYTAKCVLPNCEWHISARCIQESNNFQVRKMNDIHTCSNTQILPNNKHANRKVLGNILKELMKQDGRVYRAHDIRLDMSNRYKISLSYNQAWRAKCYAIELLRGSTEESFRILPLYLHNLKLSNPGSVTNILTDETDRFVMSYMSIGAAIRSFVNHARPIIIIDGAHLKGGYLGSNLIAVGMDANNGILPLAYGIGAGETTDHWTWFLANLRDALQSNGCCVENLTFISDRASSIAAAISCVFPEAFHGLCCRHLLGNLKTSSKRVKHFEWHYWKMCKAYRKSDFDHHFRVLSRRLPDSVQTLVDVGVNRWSRHHADRVRYAYLTSNSAESMNALSVHARKLPVTMLLEFFRASIQQWFWEHRNTASALTTPVTPYAEHKLGKRNGKSRQWVVKPSTNTILEVLDGRKNGTVNLETRTCSCKQWQLSGIPCGHVMAVARYFNIRDVTGHVERYFSTETYQAAYTECILPLDHSSEWVDPGNLMTVRPPVLVRRQSGRPKGHARIPSKGEEKSTSTRKCSRCLEYGHSRSVCTSHYDRSQAKGKAKGKQQASQSQASVKKQTSRSKAKGKQEVSQSSQYYDTVHLSQP